MGIRLGGQTVALTHQPYVLSRAAIAGRKEGEGPLAEHFDRLLEDELGGEESWEKAERVLFTNAVSLCAEKAAVRTEDIQLLLGGDLLNQIISASFAARTLGRPFLGLYGACSTMSESLLVGSLLVDGGGFENAMCAASSHFCTAERQFRYPLELGSQRTPTAQWTVTGAGATLLSRDLPPDAQNRSVPRITRVTPGRVVDLGISDANNMGAAMAPAAADTIMAHFSDTGTSAKDYDLIATGDLGVVGWDLLVELMKRNGAPLDEERTIDCGKEIFSEEQDTHARGSGCGCSAVVLNGWILKRMEQGELGRVLFLATGALLSSTSSLQGDTIPGVAHAVCLEV